MTIFSIFLFAISAHAEPAQILDCHYAFMSIPFTEIQLGMGENGPEEFVTEIIQGRSHRESFTPVKAEAGVLLHGWIAKESKENEIEMIVYKEPQKTGQSVLINHKVPMGKEVWGSCAIRQKDADTL